MYTQLFILLFTVMIVISGCQDDAPPAGKPPQPPASSVAADQDRPAAAQQPAIAAEQQPTGANDKPEQTDQELPRPPIAEDFQGEPQLSLFPRVGDYRPADDSDRLPYWKTFIDHLVKITGVAEEQVTGNRAWVFRSIDSIDSVGYFSPLAVDPRTSYQVSFSLATELTAGASAGIGILEFNNFLWVPSQYTEEQFKQHYRGSQEGKRLTGTSKGKHTFTFTTGPETQMIHLVLFREGTHDRNSVMFDDIKIKEVNSGNEKTKS